MTSAYCTKEWWAHCSKVLYWVPCTLCRPDRLGSLRRLRPPINSEPPSPVHSPPPMRHLSPVRSPPPMRHSPPGSPGTFDSCSPGYLLEYSGSERDSHSVSEPDSPEPVGRLRSPQGGSRQEDPVGQATPSPNRGGGTFEGSGSEEQSLKRPRKCSDSDSSGSESNGSGGKYRRR